MSTETRSTLPSATDVDGIKVVDCVDCVLKPMHAMVSIERTSGLDDISPIWTFFLH